MSLVEKDLFLLMANRLHYKPVLQINLQLLTEGFFFFLTGACIIFCLGVQRVVTSDSSVDLLIFFFSVMLLLNAYLSAGENIF